MTKTLLVFATEKEAQACLDHYVPERSSNINIYQFAQGYILICGMGLVSAATQVALYAHLADRVWNLGIAGALHDHLPIGSVQKVAQVAKHLSLYPEIDDHSKQFAHNVFPTLQLTKNGLRLMSSDYPVYEPILRQQLSEVSDLVDMEGYGIAFAAAKAGKECTQWKLVSDLAKPGNFIQIIENMPKFSQQLLDHVKTQFKEERQQKSWLRKVLNKFKH